MFTNNALKQWGEAVNYNAGKSVVHLAIFQILSGPLLLILPQTLKNNVQIMILNILYFVK